MPDKGGFSDLTVLDLGEDDGKGVDQAEVMVDVSSVPFLADVGRPLTMMLGAWISS